MIANHAEEKSSHSSFSKPLEIEAQIASDASVGGQRYIWSIPRKDFFSTSVSLFGATFGIGSLGLASVVAQVGIVGWLVVFVLALFVNFITIDSLIYFAHQFGLVNYVDISTLVGGRFVKVIILILFFITNIGTLLSASAIYNGLVCNIVRELGFTSHALTNKLSLVWLVIPAVLLFPILIKRQLKDVAFLTLISLGSAFYIVFFLLWAFLFKGQDNGDVPGNATPYVYFYWTNLPGAFGYLTFTLMCQPNVMGIYKELSEKSIPNMKKMVVLHLGFFIFVYTSMSLLGYMIFYDHPLIEEFTILELFGNGKSRLLFVANVLMTVAAFNSFIFSFKPVKDTIIQLLQGSDQPEKVEEESDFEPLNLSVTSALFCFIILMSGFLTLNKVGFLDIIDLLCNIVLPVLFVMLPLYAFCRKQYSALVYGALALAGTFYAWKMIEYAIAIARKLAA